jgi:CRISPR-associated protein Cas1
LHIGKQLSFVYDVADLYKVDITIPAAFRATREGSTNLESRVRKNCRDLFLSTRLLERIVPDLQRVVGLAPQTARLFVHEGTNDVEEGIGADPGALWNEDETRTAGARNFGANNNSPRPGPSVAKTVPPPERGDAYEGDLDFQRVSSGDDTEPF